MKSKCSVSILVPTRNRRAFIPQLISNYLRQDFRLDDMELVVADDGDDCVEDLFARLQNVRYLRLNKVLPIGAKRNLLAKEARGEFLVHMDDDDYYPPTRVSHAVDSLSKGNQLIAGSSKMYIYNVGTRDLVTSGPFGPGHATANTLAYRKQYLTENAFDDDAVMQEEPKFTRGFANSMIQLDSRSTIVCIAHTTNTFAKSLVSARPADLKLKDLITCKETLRFYRHKLPRILGLEQLQV